VLSLSFGGSGTCRNPDSEADRLYQQAVVALRAKGALVVASAGNGDGSTGAGGLHGRPTVKGCWPSPA